MIRRAAVFTFALVLLAAPAFAEEPDAETRFHDAYVLEVIDGEIAEAAKAYLALVATRRSPTRIREESRFRFAICTVLLGRPDEGRMQLAAIVAERAHAGEPPEAGEGLPRVDLDPRRRHRAGEEAPVSGLRPRARVVVRRRARLPRRRDHRGARDPLLRTPAGPRGLEAPHARLPAPPPAGRRGRGRTVDARPQARGQRVLQGPEALPRGAARGPRAPRGEAPRAGRRDAPPDDPQLLAVARVVDRLRARARCARRRPPTARLRLPRDGRDACRALGPRAGVPPGGRPAASPGRRPLGGRAAGRPAGRAGGRALAAAREGARDHPRSVDGA